MEIDKKEEKMEIDKKYEPLRNQRWVFEFDGIPVYIFQSIDIGKIDNLENKTFQCKIYMPLEFKIKNLIKQIEVVKDANLKFLGPLMEVEDVIEFKECCLKSFSIPKLDYNDDSFMILELEFFAKNIIFPD